jgi:hypothetical protein
MYKKSWGTRYLVKRRDPISVHSLSFPLATMQTMSILTTFLKLLLGTTKITQLKLLRMDSHLEA